MRQKESPLPHFIKPLSLLIISLALLCNAGAKAASFQELYPDFESQITTLQSMSECRAVMEYYASYMGIGFMVNEQVLGMDPRSDPQQTLVEMIDKTIAAANRLMRAQRSFVGENLQALPEGVTVEIAQSAFYTSLERITLEMAGPKNSNGPVKKQQFLRKYKESYRKCSIFLHD